MTPEKTADLLSELAEEIAPEGSSYKCRKRLSGALLALSADFRDGTGGQQIRDYVKENYNRVASKEEREAGRNVSPARADAERRSKERGV